LNVTVKLFATFRTGRFGTENGNMPLEQLEIFLKS
jgi:hypothetical protein